MSLEIPFSPPRIDQKIIDEVVDTLKSGWITTGPKTKLFEKQLTAYTGAKATLCLNSATAGLEIMLRWFGVKDGDEVILPACTYGATANVIIHCGAKPVFVDTGNDFNISIKGMRKAITKNTKVIMPVDFGGWPCDYDEINALVNEPQYIDMFDARTAIQKTLGRVLILSDSAHAIGAKYNGKMSGSFTDVSVFSFHAVKNITTAEGGAIALNLPPQFNNEEIYQYLTIKANHGQSKNAMAKLQPGAWKYDIVEAGYKFNMTDIVASIGLVELERYESDALMRRKEIIAHYKQLLSGYSWAKLPVMKSDKKESSYHLFPLRINGVSEQQRDEIIAQIGRKGIAVNVHFIPIPMMSYYKALGYDITDYPNSYNNYKAEISLPVYYDLSLHQVEQVVQTLADAVNNVLGNTPALTKVKRQFFQSVAL
jgi:dTDP-4-amino-4,6-dideoxygalactose transaminase